MSTGASGARPAAPYSELARRQASLVSALVRGTPAPPGFDSTGLRRTARTLVRKRWAAVRRHWPVATAAVIAAAGRAAAGSTAADAFAAWAEEHRDAGGLPLGGFADGYRFLAWLEAADRLPDPAAAELAQARLFWRPAGGAFGAGLSGLSADLGGVVPRAWRVRATGRARGASGEVVATAWGSATRPRGLRTCP